MNSHLRLLFLVSVSLAAALLVKSESTFEIDKNGDEFEVKRFNIQGRQLNAGRSQCVEIRRKRDVPPQPSPLYFVNGANDEIEDKHDEDDDDDDDFDSDAIKVEDGPAMLFYSPPIISSAVAEEQEDGANAMHDIFNQKQEELNAKNNTKKEENKEIDEQEKGHEGTTEVIEMPNLSISEEIQNAGAASASSINNETNNDSTAVVQSHAPPKVNTPTEDVISEVDDEFDFDVHEELSPTFNTLSWPTADDNPIYIYDDYDQKPIRVQKIKEGVKRNRNHQKPKRQNKYMTADNKNQKNKKRPAKTQTSHGNKNHHANTNKNKLLVRNKKIKVPQNSLYNKRQPYYNNGNEFVVKRNKNRKKAQVIYNGGDTYTWTRLDDGIRNVNCIIIRKDPPATATERPFWQFWKRRADGPRQTSANFGQRKRANLRFVP